MHNSELFGRKSINNLQYLLFKLGAKKIFLVTGKDSYDKCIIRKEVESNLEKLTVFRYCDFNINPKVEDLIKSVDSVAAFDPDTIVAIGGGSVMDTAKLLSVLPDDTQSIIRIIKGEVNIADRKKKLILIPTTAGSGSEATHFAVAYIDKMKYSVASQYLLPDAIILDPEFTDTMSKELTAVTAFDAFCHAVESFWSLGETQESSKYARESIKIILEVFENLMNMPGFSDRDKMMRASFLAGRAINISRTTAPHAISYALTQNFGIPHGLAAMLLLPAFFNLNTNMQQTNLSAALNPYEYVDRINALKKLMNVASSKEAMNKINKMLLAAGFKPRLRDYGINDLSDIKLLANSVNEERLNNNPVVLNKEQLILLLETIY